MVKEAEQHGDEDKARRQQVEARNRLDGLVYSTQKTLDENKEKLDAAALGDLQSALADARKVLEEDGDLKAMQEAENKLTQASHKLAEAVYSQQAAGAQAPPPSGEGGASDAGSDDVIDAEYVESDGKS